ncbi:MAG: hypothetical protein H0W03_05175 [Solirubrobacterales bacterium]|jgi:hypothetical protein|nr:hypothetical protein [Solirubrobacterales bacterium]
MTPPTTLIERSVHAAGRGAVAATPIERALLAADHALYGFVLNEGHRRPQE